MEKEELKLAWYEPIRDRVVNLVGIKKLEIEASFALQHIKSSKQLENATTESKQKSLLNAVQIGLTLNPVSKEAYLVPRKISYKEGNDWKSKLECCLEPSYVGLVKLLTDAGSVQNINTQIVYEGDEFDIDLGMCTVKHRPYFLSKKQKGKIIGVYSIAVLSSSNRQIEFMSIEDIEEIKKRSESYKAYQDKKIKTCIWVTDETEMIRKTIIRRIYKYLPRTEKMTQVDEAISLDNQDYIPSYGKIGFIESLIRSSVLPEDEKVSLNSEIDTMNNQRANEVITYLKQNQQKTLEQQFDEKID